MTKLIFGLWQTLGDRRKLQLLILAIGMAFTGIFEMLSLAVFGPLLAALASPKGFLGIAGLARIRSWIEGLGFEIGGNLTSDLAVLATFFGLFTGIAGAMRILVVWANARLTAILGTDISSRVYETCLNLSYREHLDRGSAELISLVRDKAGYVNTIIFYLLNLFSSSLIALMICIGLFLLHPFFTLSALAVLGGFYVLIGWACRSRLIQNSRTVVEQSTKAVKAVQEGLGSIRDVILDKSEKFYENLFRQAERRVQQASAQGIFLSTAPRYLTETFTMIVFSMVLLIWLLRSNETPSPAASVLPIFGVLALGAQRSMPLLQQIYTSWAVVSSGTVALEQVLRHSQKNAPKRKRETTISINFLREISLRGVSFRYRNELPWVIKELNLNIPKGSCVGIRGITGSGKSTLVDLIMGLLEPSEGALEVDGIKISENNVVAWQKNIAHVPQAIFLADVSIAENIALGIERNKIDMVRVRKAARQACINEFIESTKDGYEVTVGERGVRLSGGQRQRLGIARALYRQAEVLILDEATSALDNETELAVIKSINKLNSKLTILMIAHRLSSLEGCDQIIELDRQKGINFCAGEAAKIAASSTHLKT